ncbi:MAG: hypothetical protein ACK46X_20215 [Candidatus Sericytochromatia bacterium]
MIRFATLVRLSLLPVAACLAVTTAAPAPVLAAIKTEAQAVAVVQKKLAATPELKARVKALKHPLVLRVEAKPGEQDGYYHVYAGENLPDHTARIWTLLVDPRTDEVKGYDPLSDEALTWKAFVAKVKRQEL